MKNRTCSGFTLIELMVSISVLAILSGLAYPSFTDSMRNNRIVTQSNELVTAFNMARAEAAKRGIVVSVCSTNAAQTACGGPSNWNSGWMIFTDATGAVGNCNACDAGGDEILLKWPAPTSGVHLDTSTTPPNSISFRADGSVTGTVVTPATLTVLHSSCKGSHARRITIRRTGSLRSEAVAC